jgi:hypothetical protein
MLEQGTTNQPDLSRPPKHRTVPVWIIAVAISFGVITIGLLAWSLRGCANEVNRLSWPPQGVSAREAAAVDLERLGLSITSVSDASESAGQGLYIDSAYVEYDYAGTRALTITMLKYESAHSASKDFASYEAWAEQSGVVRVNFNFGSVGWVKLTFGDGRSKLLWHGNWMVEVLALEVTDRAPGDLLDEVMDALSSHWREMGAREVLFENGRVCFN